jgi:hypothetical protein
MGRKYLVILLALIIACSALMIGAPQAQAAGPWYVNPLGADDGSHGAGTGALAFKTIQYAINDARVVTGDTINVAAGTYPESVNVTKDVTIAGVGPTTIVAPVSGSGLAGFTVTASGATIRDLRVTSGVNETGIGIRAADDVTLNGLVIDKTGLDTDKPGIFIFGTGAGSGSATCASSDRLTIQNCTITIAGENNGIYASDTSPAHTGWLIGGVGNGNTISAPLGNPLELHDVTNSEVSYNHINGGNGVTGGNTVIWSSNRSNLSGLAFNYNVVDGSGPGHQVVFITDFGYLPDDNTTIAGVTITGNTFSNWFVGAALRIFPGVTEVAVHHNSFVLTSGATALRNTSTVVDATYNWWGSSAPNWTTTASGLVTYTPWDTDTATTGAGGGTMILTIAGVQLTVSGAGTALACSLPDNPTGVGIAGLRGIAWWDIYFYSNPTLPGNATVVVTYVHRTGEETFKLYYWNGSSWISADPQTNTGHSGHSITAQIPYNMLQATPVGIFGDTMATWPSMDWWALVILCLGLLGPAYFGIRRTRLLKN